MKTNEIRSRFIEYFKRHQHEHLPSSSLIPANDPTLLFTNAGMVQFKEVFLGLESRPYKRAVTSQRCVRAGGKHNDLDNVGYTARHHTFFEMLGNFSFGDYFKREAIKFAWEFLTKELGLPPEKLWVTVFEEDTEAENIWLQEMKIDPTRFTPCGEKSNFWAMGDTGPCGPCTEIFYDHGPEVAGGPPGSPDEDGDRYVEIWNLVFMQYDRSSSGELSPLPKPSVDTGMGLERIAAVMQGVHSNYDIDLFQSLIQAIRQLCPNGPKQSHSYQVIADHIRSCSFLIADGVVPSNEGRGYVLRRIIRRAIRHGHQLGLREAFFYKLVAPLILAMGTAFPELKQAQGRIETVILTEEQQFEKTLTQGLKIFEDTVAALKTKTIPGEIIFKLYDTYGFPADLTADLARERQLALDMDGFEMSMAKQRELSQQASQFAVDYHQQLHLEQTSEFTGYHEIGSPSVIIGLLKDSHTVSALKSGDKGIIILKATPFYAESGGQVGDTGVIHYGNAKFLVTDTQKHQQAILHIGHVVHGEFHLNMEVLASVDEAKRRATMMNHSATHLLHAALRQILGEHVIQKGSLVDPNRLRFDFAHYEPVNAEQLQQIEKLVNDKIQENIHSTVEVMTPDQAKQSGAMALFGEKYGDKVRVLTIGDFSKELCGGTHVHDSGEIGLFKIVSESGVAAGIRRLEAITGAAAIEWVQRTDQELNELASLLKAPRAQIFGKISTLLQHARQLEKELSQLKGKFASHQGADLTSRAVDIEGIKVLAVHLPGVETTMLRDTLDQLKNKLGRAVVVLAASQDKRVNVVAGISKELVGRVPSPKSLVQSICGQGGGRDDMAQGGGALPADLDAKLARIPDMIAEHALKPSSQES